MGDDATHAAATPEQIAAMVELLHESLRAGALGFSSSLGEAHTDGDGAPVPSRAAQPDEFLALARAVRDHAGTSLEFIPGHGRDLRRAHRAHDRHVAGRRSPAQLEPARQRVAHAGVRAAAHVRPTTPPPTAPRVVALALPDVMRLRSSRMLQAMPGWGEVIALPDAERRAAVADPAVRERLRDRSRRRAARRASPG